jgi:hypothetical protein
VYHFGVWKGFVRLPDKTDLDDDDDDEPEIVTGEVVDDGGVLWTCGRGFQTGLDRGGRWLDSGPEPPPGFRVASVSIGPFCFP